MTSDRRTPDSAFVWVWLPGETEPVVAGRITSEGDRYAFNYGASYLDRANAIPLYTPELPLQRGRIDPPPNMEMASCLRGAIHRMDNPGKVDLVLIEVQTGAYLGEDDIVRYEDVYARM